MRTHTWIVMAAAAAVTGLLGSASAGDAPTPREIARHCIQRAAALAGHCAQRNIAFAAECVEHMEALIEQGHPEAAVHLAMRCVHRTNLRSRRCVERIDAGCRRCVALLLELDEPRLAQTVAAACHEAAEVVNESRRSAIVAIRDALPEGGGDGVGGGDGGGGLAAACPADVDLDGAVGPADLAALLEAWGGDPMEPPDLDGDGVVASRDLVALIAAWGPCD